MCNFAHKFVEKLSKMTGRHFRLPTETEWKYAARGGQKSKGYMYAGANDTALVAWQYTDSLSSHHMTVATKACDAKIK